MSLSCDTAVPPPLPVPQILCTRLYARLGLQRPHSYPALVKLNIDKALRHVSRQLSYHMMTGRRQMYGTDRRMTGSAHTGDGGHRGMRFKLAFEGCTGVCQSKEEDPPGHKDDMHKS